MTDRLLSHEKYNESHLFNAQRGSKVEEMRNNAKCNCDLVENESHRQQDNFTKVRRKFGGNVRVPWPCKYDICFYAYEIRDNTVAIWQCH